MSSKKSKKSQRGKRAQDKREEQTNGAETSTPQPETRPEEGSFKALANAMKDRTVPETPASAKKPKKKKPPEHVLPVNLPVNPETGKQFSSREAWHAHNNAKVAAQRFPKKFSSEEEWRAHNASASASAQVFTAQTLPKQFSSEEERHAHNAAAEKRWKQRGIKSPQPNFTEDSVPMW